jgi:DNA repair exonuclease SbcCD ATPase subunit
MRFAKIGLVAVLVLPVGPIGIAVARQRQTSGTSQQEDSLAAAARRAREQKKQQPKASKVWSNDDIPKTAGLSVVGQGAPAEDNNANPPANAPGEAKPGADAGKKPSAADLAAAKDQLQTLQNDLEILQRKFTLDQQSSQSKPGYSLDNSGAENLKDEQDQIDAKQQEISDAQKRIEDLQKQPAPTRANQSTTSSTSQPKSPN